MTKEFPYSTVLVLGATSGIGLALSEKLIADGSFVIGVGRRQENLDSFVEKHGREKAAGVRFDITDLEGIPSFVEKVTKDFPKLDCVFLNSGIQRGMDFTKPETLDLPSVQKEMTTNYTAHVHFLKYLLPFLQSHSSPTSLIFTTSGLALVPLLRAPNYSASKAAMHHLILCLRQQLSDMPKNNVKVVEILPPAVQTELHDEKHQPDIKNGASIGMTMGEFMKEAWEGLCEGKDDVPVGTSRRSYGEDGQGWEMKRQEAFRGMVAMIKKMMEGK